MRNLKRVLSLALALVMVLGMMVITTSAADFTDAEEITYTEAVDVISAIGVITGDNGSFYPNRALTREEGAAFICYLLMGKDKADKLTGSGNFADVAADRWSAGEIDYCNNLGIILGYTNADGETVFNPKGELTAVAFGRMLLGALGYDGNVEGYTGTNWASSIAADMIAVGLDLNGVDMDAVLTREQAAEMVLKALTKTMVDYEDKGTSITIGGVEIVTGAKKAEVEKWAGTEGKDYTDGGASAANETIEFCEKYFKDLNLDNNDTDDYGRPAHTWYNGNRAVAKNKVGTYANKANHTIQVTKGGKTMAYWIDTVSTKYGDPTATVYNNGGGAGNDALNLGYTIELFMNRTNPTTVDKAVVTGVALEKISKVTAVENDDYDYTVKFDGGRTYTDKALPGFDAETMEKDTFVLVTYGVDNSTVLNVEVAPYITGVMTASGNNYIKVDGEKKSTVAGYTVGDDYTNTYNFFTDNSGNVLGKDQVTFQDTNDGFVYLMDYESQAKTGTGLGLTSKDAKVLVKVAYMDGSVVTETYEVKDSGNAGADIVAWNGSGYATEATEKKNTAYITIEGVNYEVGADNTMDTLLAAGFYAYSKNEDGEIVLKSKTAATDHETTTTTLVKDSTVIDGTYIANSDTKLVVIDSATKKTAEYTGYKNFPSTAVSGKPALVITGRGSSIAKTVYVMDTVTSENVTYAYYTGIAETRGTKSFYTFYVNGEAVEYELSAAPNAAYTVFTVNEVAKTSSPVTTKDAIVDETDANFFITVTNGGTNGVTNVLPYAAKYQVWDLTGDEPVAGVVAEGDSIKYAVDGNGKVTIVYIVKDYVAAQPTTRAEVETLLDDSVNCSTYGWEALPTVGLGQSVDASTIYLSGTLTDVLALADEDFADYTAALTNYFGGSYADADALKTFLQTTYGSLGTIESAGFAIVTQGDYCNVLCVVGLTDGSVKSISTRCTDATCTAFTWQKNGVRVTIDIAGLSF